MSDLIFSSLFVTLNRFHTLFGVSTVDFKQVNTGWYSCKMLFMEAISCRIIRKCFFLIGIHSTQGQTATARIELQEKEAQKD